MSKIVVVGSCNIDITVECDRWVHPGETIFGNRLTVSPGGKGANQAVAAARLGADVMMVGCIGDDVYGQLVLKALKENNVDSTYVKVLPGENSGTAHITVAEDDNTIIVIKAANGYRRFAVSRIYKNGTAGHRQSLDRHRSPVPIVFANSNVADSRQFTNNQLTLIDYFQRCARS